MRTQRTLPLYEIYCVLCFGGLLALMSGGALMVFWRIDWGMGLVLAGGIIVLVAGALAHKAQYSTAVRPSLNREIAAWRDRHLNDINKVTYGMAIVSLTLIIASLAPPQAAVAPAERLKILVAGIVLMIGAIALGFYVARRTRARDEAQSRLATPATIEPPVFDRPLPAWGEPGAFEDFEDYLRGQLAPALAIVNTDPCDGSIGALGSYLNDLFGDACAGHDILAQIILPAGWTVPATWRPEADGFRPPVRHAWLRLIARVGIGPVFEVAYQLFGQDITLVRFPLG